MITSTPNKKLSVNPGFDIKIYLDGNIILNIDTDSSIPMAIKFSSQNPYCSMNGFPVFRMSSKIRKNIKNQLIKYKPNEIL